MLQKALRIAKRKSVIALVILLIGGGAVYARYFRTTTLPLRYVLSTVTRGTVVSTVSGTGQVSGQNQIDVKPTVSGLITKILVKPGDEVKKGTVLMNIDQKTALKAVRDAARSLQDARLSLASAELSLKKLRQPPDAVALLQATNNLEKAKRDLAVMKAGPDAFDLQQAENDLAAQKENIQLAADGKTPKVVRNAYDDTVPILKSVSQTLQLVLNDADSILGIDHANLNTAYKSLLSVLDSSKLMQATVMYQGVKVSVATLRTQSDGLNISGEDIQKIDTMLVQAQSTMQLMEPFLQTMQDVLSNTIVSATFSQSSLDALRNMIQSDRTNVSTKLSTLTGQIQAIDQAKSSYQSSLLSVQRAQISLEKLKRGTLPKDIAAQEEVVAEAQASLVKLQKGTEPVDISLSQNSVDQRRSAVTVAAQHLADAKETLNDYNVQAPFDGIVAKVLVHEHDQASASAGVVTLLTKLKIAQLTLNEVDVAKVHPKQKAILTFDAVQDVTMAGEVSEVDAVGTVTQGVVSYAVKIAFETTDDRIKPGMSVSASIVTNAKADVLVVPNGAIKQQSGTSMVQMLSNPDPSILSADQGVTSANPPENRPVQVGASNDQITEITEGLNEGDQIVTRTIDPNTAAARTAATTGSSSAIRIPGLTGGSGSGNFGGGATRAATGR